MVVERQSSSVSVNGSTPLVKKKRLWRELVAYWILGLCNNYGYVVMLTAADDIISSKSTDKETHSGPRNCVYLSTGAILLADILPSLVVKTLAPFLPFFVHIRVIVCVVVACGGYLLVAFGSSIEISLLGVVLTSFCSGLGEVTFLQYSSFYDKKVISTWSSGTGGAGVIGALSYTVLQQLGFQTTLLILLVVPLAMAVSFFVILPKPDTENEKLVEVQLKVNSEEVKNPKAVFIKKLKLIPGLLKYMIPLGTVYLFEYFINQGTFELIKIENDFVDVKNQYHWLQVDYQIGVFLSRSSVNLFHIKYVWILSALQFLNVIVFTTEAIYYYIPAFWVILILVFWEGLLGGSAYVNTFYNLSSETKEEDKQFSMGTTSFSDTIGITIAGLLAIYVHNQICDLPLPVQNKA